MLAPVLVVLAVSGAVPNPAPEMDAYYLRKACSPRRLLGVLIPALRWALSALMRYGDESLGYLGERFVGDCLEPLKRQGWYVLHDMPGEAGERKFNIDHVAVGPGGVWAIETKTRRKGRARPGFEPHKVFFDGKQLIWPWGEDAYGTGTGEK